MEVRRGYKRTEIGVIPEDWEVKKIDEEIDLLTGFPFSSKDFAPNGIRLLKCSNVKRNETDWDENITDYWISFTSDLKKYLLKEGDIVIAMDGSLVGKSFARLTKLDLPALLVQRVARVRSTKINMNYLKELICSDYFSKYSELVKTSSAIPHISPLDIRNYQIPVPPTKHEQEAIAGVLSDVDELIAKLDKQIEKKRAIKQGAMQELLKPKEGWEEKKLGEIADIVGGGTPSTFITEYWNGEINWFTPTEIGLTKYTYESLRRISKEGLANCSAKILPIGTVLLTSRAGIGDVSILQSEGCTNQGFQSLVIRKDNNEFIYYLMLTLRDALIQNASGSTFLEISPNRLKQIKIAIPTLEEQTRIAQILSDMDAEIEALEKKRDKYKQLKQGLMQELLTGKTRLA